MRKLLFLCLFFLSMLAQSQHPLNMEKFADSLYVLLKNAPNDSVKAATYFNLVAYWLPKDSLKANESLEKGYKLVGNNVFLKGAYHAKMGYLYYYYQDLANSKKHYLIAANLLQKVPDVMAYKLLADVWNNIGVIYQIEGNDNAYIETLLNKAILYAEKAKDQNRVATYYISLGVCFLNLEQYPKSIHYLNEAEQILIKDQSQEFRLVPMYNRIIEAYLLSNDLSKAKEYIEKARVIFNKNPSSEQIALFHMVEGIYYKKTKNYKKAIALFNLGLSKVAGPNKIYHAHEININKLETLIEQKSYKEALLLAKNLENDPYFVELEENKAMVFLSLAQIYYSTNQLRLAYDYLNKHSDLKTQLYEKDLKEQINQLETKFNTQAKEKELAALKNQQKEVQLELKNSRLYMALALAGMIIFLLVALLIFIYYKNDKKALAQKEIIHKQRITETEREKKLSVTSAVLEGQERERERVAKDLHDGLGGMLAGISVKFSVWEAKYLKEEGKEDFKKNKQQLDNAIAELRNISRNLMPESLLKYGLEAALEDLCEFYQSPKLHIDFQWYDVSNDIKLTAKLSIYRIIQELITNAVKHAKATQLLIQCSQNQNHFFITVEDNGEGFNINDTMNKGMGLQNVRNRVAFLNGKIEVLSAKADGTTVNIEIDLNNLRDAEN